MKMISKIKRQCHVTLLEVLIAMGLLSVLMTTVLGVYQHMNWLQQEVTQTEKRKFRLLYVQYRLSEIIPLARAKEEKAVAKQEHDFYFYTTEGDFEKRFPSLVLTYDNGISSPDFSNEVIGKIYVDGEDRLCLSTWPAIERVAGSHVPMRKEVLLEGVEKLAFSFYLAPRESNQKKAVDPVTEQKYGKWHAEWPVDGVDPEEVTVPPLMKMAVTISKGAKESETIYFAFLLPYSEQHIEYRK